PEAGFEALNQFLANRAREHRYDQGVFYKYDSPQSIRHLFRVVCGMESMVIGETEILGQVKKAYGTATTAGSTARHLNKLFQRAFNVAKEVRTKTNITRGSVSVGSTAVDLSEKIFGRLSNCNVMILGAGETAELTSRTLLSRGLKSIAVANRSAERAVELAGAIGGRAVPFEEWHKEFLDIDILIGSTSAPQPIVTREKIEPVMKQRKDRPLFIIDLAVPRDVEPGVNDLEGVYLYDIDSLQAIAQQSLEIRRREVVVCEQMIERHVGDFSSWLTNDSARFVAGNRTAPLERRATEL
ncbi:MAG: glutamyl-tRNA reductase, partial [Verrucomicrobiota bacterium]